MTTTMHAWPIVFVLVIVSLVTTSVTSYEPCDICAYTGVTIANPDALVDSNLTCGELAKLSHQGEFDYTNCNILQALDFPQSVCGCSVPPRLELCNICGNPQGYVTNLTQIVQVPKLGNVTCQDLQGYGGLFSGGSVNCSNVATSDIPTLCGCHVFEPAPIVCDTATKVALGETVHGVSTGHYYADLFQICGGSLSGSVAWYTVTGTGATIKADVCGGFSPSHAIVVTGPSCDSLSCVDFHIASDSSCNAVGTSVTWFANASQVYYILTDASYNLLLNVSSATDSPTMSPTPTYECNICGENFESLTFLDVVVNVPIFGNITCSDLQDLLLGPGVSPSSCSAVLAANATRKACGCTDVANSPGTCDSAATIAVGQTVYDTFSGADVSETYNITLYNVENCGLSNSFHGSYFGAGGLWYRFVGTGSLAYIVLCDIVGAFPDVYVLTGRCDGNLSCVGTDDDAILLQPSAACGEGELFGPKLSWMSNLGQEYHILVQNSQSVPGNTDDKSSYDFALTITDRSTHFNKSSLVSDFLVCYICGKDKRVANPSRVIHLLDDFWGELGGSVTTCGDLELTGLNNGIDPWSCAELLYSNYTQQACGCEAASPGPHSCRNATVLAVGENLVNISSKKALTEYETYNLCNMTVGPPHAWYRFIGIGNEVTVDTHSVAFQVMVMAGTCDKLTCVEASLFSSSATWLSKAGENYYIVVSFSADAIALLLVGPSLFRGDDFLTITLNAQSDAPSSSPTMNVSPQAYPRCNICGNNDYRISLYDSYTNYGQVYSCSELETEGLSNQIHPLVCSVLEKSDVSTTCGCMPPAVNYDCSTAIDVGVGESINGSTFVTAPGINYTECGSGLSSFTQGVWYRHFDSGKQVEAKVSPISSSFINSALTVYHGSCECRNCVSDESGYGIVWSSTPGGVSYIYVQTDNPAIFTLTVSVPDTFAPTQAATNYPSCNMCGVSDGRVTKSHMLIDQQGIAVQGVAGDNARNITCAELESSALQGQIDPSTCDLLHILEFPKICGCNATGPTRPTATANGTPSNNLTKTLGASNATGPPATTTVANTMSAAHLSSGASCVSRPVLHLEMMICWYVLEILSATYWLLWW